MPRKSNSSRSCSRQSHLKKYRTRPSPAYPANECCGTSKVGNDGKRYWSTPNKNGVCTWKPSPGRKLRRRSSSKSCKRMDVQKYRNRPSPACPANECCGSVKKGNDGRMYISEPNKLGICSWRPLAGRKCSSTWKTGGQ